MSETKRTISPAHRIIRTARDLVAGRAFDYKARNGRTVEIQGDDGERCFIVHSDFMFALENALTAFDERLKANPRDDDGDAFFRLYGLSSGHVLTVADIDDLEKVLNDYNDELGASSDAYHAAREQVLREIGGDELVQAAALADKWQSKVAVDRALAHFYSVAAEHEAKAKGITNGK